MKLEKITKNLVSGQILDNLAQVWAPKVFVWILPQLHVRRCCKVLLYTFSRKNKLEKIAKNLVLGQILPRFGPNMVPKIIFRRLYLY